MDWNEPDYPTRGEPCPLLETQARISGLSRDMVKALRKLRRDVKNCHTCQDADDCPILKDLNSKINTAIQEVIEEWNLESWKMERSQ